jgi:serine/threonine protein phosphatase PrpC
MMSGRNVFEWRGFCDSEIGPLHQRLGLPNQDACHLELENGVVLIALSDGVGSKELSHLGAEAVCRAVVRLGRYCVSEQTIEPLFWLEQFHRFWLDELQGVEVEKCSCTALFAMIFGDQTLIAQLGDGACCIVTSEADEPKKTVRFLADKDDDLFSNQTQSLGRKFQASDWSYCLQSTAELDSCFLVTDGIADDIRVEHRANFFIDLLNQYRPLTDDEIKTDVRHWISQWPVQGHSDDKTIVALFRQYTQHNKYSGLL